MAKRGGYTKYRGKRIQKRKRGGYSKYPGTRIQKTKKRGGFNILSPIPSVLGLKPKTSPGIIKMLPPSWKKKRLADRLKKQPKLPGPWKAFKEVNKRMMRKALKRKL